MALNSSLNDTQIHCAHLFSIPSVDLRCFSGDELLLLAESSGQIQEAYLREHSIPPIIDELFFNESVASRKQTYCNLGSNNGRSGKALPAEVFARSGVELGSDHVNKKYRAKRKVEGSEKWVRSAKAAANASLASLAANIETKRVSGDDTCASFDGRVGKYSQEKRQTRELTGSVTRPTSTDWEDWKCRGSARELKLSTHVDENGHLATSDPVRFPSKETPTSKTEPSLNKEFCPAVYDCIRLEQMMRRNGKKRITSAGSAAGSMDDVGRLNEKKCKVLVDQIEVERRLEQESMVDLLAQTKGRWSSDSRTRKVVDAVGFPKGWTVHMGLSHKDGRTQFEYTDWRSPEGSLWPSFKDASSFLLSSMVYNSAVEFNPVVNASQAIRSDEVVSFTKEAVTCGEYLMNVASAVANSHFSSDHSQLVIKARSDMDGEEKCLSQTDLDQLFGAPHIYGAFNLLPVAIEGEVASMVDTFTSWEAHWKVASTLEVQHSHQAGCQVHGSLTGIGVMDKQCLKHVTHQYNSFQRTDLKQIEKDVDFCRTDFGMKCRDESAIACSGHALCCNTVRPNQKCLSFGSTFSTLLESLWHHLEMGHPQVTTAVSNSRRLIAQDSGLLTCLSASGMTDIVWGLLCDSYKDSACQEDCPSLLYCPTSFITFKEASDELQKQVSLEVTQCFNYFLHTGVNESSEASQLRSDPVLHLLFAYWSK